MAESKSVSVTYLGPAHFIEHEGRVYQPGAKITMSEEQARRMVGSGHALDGYRVPTPDEFSSGGVQGNRMQQEATQEAAAREADKAPAPPGTPPDEALVAEAKEVRSEQRQQARESRA